MSVDLVAGPECGGDTGEPVTVVIADRYALFREALRDALGALAGFQVIGEAADLSGSLALSGRLRPDILVLDVELLGDGTPRALSELVGDSPGTGVVVVTMRDDPRLVYELLDLGVRGYLHKSASRGEIVTALATVRADRDRVVLSMPRASIVRPRTERADGLSLRERQVLTLVANALSNRQIGARLHITEGTVKRHLRNIFGKLQAVSRIDAVNKALSASLIGAPESQVHP
jgi:DNA-binding NarL/FixJ family response regulator